MNMMKANFMTTIAHLIGVFFINYVCGQRPNNAPLFRNTLQDLFQNQGIPENTDVGSIIGTLRAVDPDGDRVTYSMVYSDYLSVNSETGEVKLEAVLDRERYTQIPVTFIAMDSMDNKVQISYPMTIVDVNDNSPVFTGVPYQAEIIEGTGAGSLVFSGVSITDRDAAVNARISLSCYAELDEEAKNACEMFTVSGQQTEEGEYQGFINLNGELDFEQKRQYIMTLLAVDSGVPSRSSSVNLVIEVIDAQDNNPRFINAPLTLVVNENSEKGLVVGELKAQDQDKGNPRPIQMSIVSDMYNYFEMGPSQPDLNGVYSSEIRVAGNIDRETMRDSRYLFQVKVVELENGAITEYESETVVTVDIQDQNDNAPMFLKQNYEKYVNEGATGNLYIGDLIVTDPDSGSNAEFQLQIIDSPFGTFQISPTEGRNTAAVSLVVQRPQYMDYEKPENRMQVVKIKASEKDTTEQRSSTATVTIHLQDLNDNSPTFSQAIYTATVNEQTDASRSTIIATVEAEDPDNDGNDEIFYSLSGNYAERFDINDDGQVRVIMPLDYETVSNIQLTIEAQDRGGLSSQALLRITVLNNNDEGPIFTLQQYITSVDETSTRLEPAVIIQATDADSEQITYRIISGNTIDNAFYIDPRSGRLTLTRPIPFAETQNSGSISLVVEASDNGPGEPLTSQTTIIITVRDVNDNSPKFEQETYTASVSELAPANKDVIMVSATDNDIGNAGEIIYEISNSQDFFYIDSTLGSIKVSPNANLNLERSPASYSLEVRAIDKGNPPLTGTTTVLIIVQDDNNQPPRFSADLYRITLPESAPKGSTVVVLEATDADSSAELRYSIKQNTFESKDRNGQPITNLGQISRMVEIDENYGIIKTLTELDREIAAQISFTAEVRDINGVNPPPAEQVATASVILYIRSTGGDIDFEKPPGARTDQLSIRIPESATVGTQVAAIVAHNPQNGQMIKNYQEVAGSDLDDYVRVEQETGAVILTKQLDFETGAKQFSLKVKAFTDDTPPQSAEIAVTAQIIDENDNRPIFLQKSYQFQVAENTRYPAQFGIVVASDADSGRYGEIRYSLSGPTSSLFNIDPIRGYISVADETNLDREDTEIYNLIVIATDNPVEGNLPQSIQRSTSISAIVKVLDINDNAPEFLRSEYTFNTIQDLPDGVELGRVAARDNDVGDNAALRYSLIEDSSDGLFGINQTTGSIYPRRTLMSFSATVYTLKVMVQDRGNPIRSDSATVRIVVEPPQGSTGTPLFLFPQQDGASVRIPENVDVGSNVTRIIVQGPMDGSKWQFGFLGIREDHKKFKIDRNTGTITVMQALDREQQARYQLIVEVSDKTNPDMEGGVRRFFVDLDDRDDNNPSFVGCPEIGNKRVWEVSITEGARSGSKLDGLDDMQACDADSAPNQRIYYYMICGNEENKNGERPFFIDRSSGVITTRIPLDREQKAKYELCIKVDKNPNLDYETKGSISDFSLLSDSSLAKVVVEVVDQNDNGPNFAGVTDNSITTGIISSIPFHTEIFIVKISDIDSINGDTIFRIASSNFFRPGTEVLDAPNAFEINSKSGVIYTNLATYRSFEGGYFNLRVEAVDNNINKKATALLTVYIVREDQQYQYVFSVPPEVIRGREISFFSEIESIHIGIQLFANSYRYPVFSNNSINTNGAELCFYVVYDKAVMSRNDAFSLLALSNNDLNSVFRKYNVTRLEMCGRNITTKTWSDQYWAWWLLIALAIFLFILALLLAVCIASLWDRYRNRLTLYKPYVVLDPLDIPFNKEYEWQETTVRMG